jgi:hypothetical protein
MKKPRLLPITLAAFLVFSLLLLAVPVQAANSILNPGIESGTGDNADNWTENFGGRINKDIEGYAHSGNYSMQLNPADSTYREIKQSFTATASTTYYYSFYFYRGGTSGNYYWRYKNSTGGTCDVGITTTVGQWVFVSGNCYSGDGGSSEFTFRQINTTSQYSWFDDVCFSATESDCAEVTPTETFTPTTTLTLTSTNTPTKTNTPTITRTPTKTNTPTITRTPTGTWSTPTSTFTPTVTPPGSLTWAESDIEPEAGIVTALEAMIISDPPAGATNLWSITHAAASPDGWYFSLSNLSGVSSPYNYWDVERNGNWLGSAECIDDSGWTCEWYVWEPPAGGGGAGIGFPWKSGESAQYGQSGVHEGYPGMIEYAVDFFPTSNETYAAAEGTVTWICSGSLNKGILLSGTAGDFLYYHLEPGTPITMGTTYRQGDYLGNLVRGTFTDTCGRADQATSSAHVHFGFEADTYFNIGGCVLTISTEIFDCDGIMIGILGNLINDGETSTGGGEGSGGAHIWDGIVAAIVDLLFEDLSDYLPTQHPAIQYWLAQGTAIYSIVLNFFASIIMGPAGAWTEVMSLALALVVTLEIAYWASKNAIMLYKFGKSVIKLLALFL